MNEITLRSSRILFEDGIRPADLVVGWGVILDIYPYGSVHEAHDLGDLLIAPGLIDLHSDAVEKEIEPRPGATFPIDSSLVELDKKLAMSGITTMFHAIAFNDESITSSRGTARAAEIIRRVGRLNTSQLEVANFLHLRFEITSFSSLPVIRELIEKGYVHLLSIMDHTPGQGQFSSIETWKQFHLPVYDLSEDRADAIIRQKQADQERAYAQVTDLLAFASRHNLILLSHDDDKPEKIDLVKDWGITISEFPLSEGVAAYAREQGLATGMGAPNIVRGMSQNGNVSARELISGGCCDFLCSDYHPSSLLQAVYVMHREMGLAFEKAMAMVTSTPAGMAACLDRGCIEPDMLADLIVIDDQDIPRVVMTLKNGEIIYTSRECLCHSTDKGGVTSRQHA